MPQLMPLNWILSMFMLMFVFFMLNKMYFMSSYQIKINNQKFLCNKNYWLW